VSWEKYQGFGEPTWQSVSELVVRLIGGGNVGGVCEIRCSPKAWEYALLQIADKRPVEFEKAENRAAIVTFICGHKTRIYPVANLGIDEFEFRAAPQ
jgi:hypothetical protein